MLTSELDKSFQLFLEALPPYSKICTPSSDSAGQTEEELLQRVENAPLIKALGPGFKLLLENTNLGVKVKLL